MKEVERLRDRALVMLLYDAARPSDHRRRGNLLRLSVELRDASEKQYDDDRDGVRRAMGKADCAEKRIKACTQVGISCATCGTASICDVPSKEDVPHLAIPTAGEAKEIAEGDRDCVYHGGHPTTELCPVCEEIAASLRTVGMGAEPGVACEERGVAGCATCQHEDCSVRITVKQN